MKGFLGCIKSFFEPSFVGIHSQITQIFINTIMFDICNCQNNNDLYLIYLRLFT